MLGRSRRQPRVASRSIAASAKTGRDTHWRGAASSTYGSRVARIALSVGDRTRIAEAIKKAEHGHRGEIVVHVEPSCLGDPLKRAAKLFAKLGVDRTADGTGVLLYVAATPARAAIWAGRGISEGDRIATWKRVFEAIGASHDDPATGILRAIEELGAVLREHVPGPDVHGDELANEVVS